MVRSWCDHGDQVQTIFLADRFKFFFFLIWHIRKDQTVDADLCSLGDKTLRAIGKYYICIGHKHKRDLYCLSDTDNHIKDLICGSSCRQCPYICFLDHRAFCCRIRKRDPQFDQVCTCLCHSAYQFFSSLQIRVSTG